MTIRFFGLAAALAVTVVLNVGVGNTSAALIDNLLGYYQFEASGSDSSGNGRDTTLDGTAVLSAGGVFGNALDLRDNTPGLGGAANAWARRPHDAAYDFGTGDYTLQAWLNIDGASPGGSGPTETEVTIMEQFIGSGGPGWTMYWRPAGSSLTPNTLRFWNGAAEGAGPALSSPGWHHAIARRDAGVNTLFFDGVSIATYNSGHDTTTTGDFYIGRRNPSDARGLAVDGLMDEVALWNRALSDQEIGQLYNNGQGQMIPEPSTLVLAGLGIATMLMIRRRTRARYGWART